MGINFPLVTCLAGALLSFLGDDNIAELKVRNKLAHSPLVRRKTTQYSNRDVRRSFKTRSLPSEEKIVKKRQNDNSKGVLLLRPVTVLSPVTGKLKTGNHIDVSFRTTLASPDWRTMADRPELLIPKVARRRSR